ncbi:MAG TPA: hypothetical protein VHD56_17495 [Tepidisphaeraceae bacterium]|nr:hypothetical protein [Tepidisphaeraceae bacterium]
MADSRLKDLLKGSKHEPAEAPQVTPPPSPSVLSRPEPFMLDLELVSGERMAIPYTSLLTVTLNPSSGITVTFSTHLVFITGVNLRPVYEAIVGRAAATLKAVGDRPAQNRDGVPVILSIEVSERKL